MQMIQTFGRHMTAWTDKNWLLAAEYRFQRPARCPILTFVRRRRLREWDQRHRVWDLRQRRHCIFSAKYRFFTHHSDGRDQLRRRQGERLLDACIQSTRGNRGLSEMVWGEIFHGGGRNLVILDGTVNRHCYIQILGDHMLSWGEGSSDVALRLCKTMPHHTFSTWHGAYLYQHDVEVMDWQTMSPGINAIEHAWDQMSI